MPRTRFRPGRRASATWRSPAPRGQDEFLGNAPHVR
jgi:hypothetical protein